jgi:uncharacterized damage-inducible protein DinB
MNARLQLVVEQFRVNDRFIRQVVDHGDEGVLFVRPLDRVNSMHWVFGHIAVARLILAQALGLKVDLSWRGLFDQGVEPREPEAYPSAGEITHAMEGISAELFGRIEQLTDEELAATPTFHLEGMEDSVAGMISHFALHECYHVGQLLYIHRIHGGDRLVG